MSISLFLGRFSSISRSHCPVGVQQMFVTQEEVGESSGDVFHLSRQRLDAL
jgi:hypothetical protein